MSDLIVETNTVSPLLAVLWVFYPMAALVLIELLLRAFNPDDDDDDTSGGKMIPVTLPSGA
jgi:hypothetical protein|tara:strand:+ start:4202 stop:4384 length:183 start_codon:yes stop_codon:yes gene_type:complete